MSEIVDCNNFTQHLPLSQWGAWMKEYLQHNRVDFSMFDAWIDVTFHINNHKETQGYLDVCFEVMQAASQQPNAFETFVLPLVSHKKWEHIGQIARNARFLPQNVCDILVAPLWSHPQCVDHFVVMNDKIRSGRLFEVHPFLHPKILCNPRLQRKYQLFPNCLYQAFNQEYLIEYGQEGFECLKQFGLIDDDNHEIALAMALCMDTPQYLTQLNNVVKVNLSQIPNMKSMYFTHDDKTGMFYSTILEMTADNSMVAFVFKDTMARHLNSSYVCPNILLAFHQAAEMVQWNERLVRSVMECCDNRYIGKCLSLLMEVVPVEHSSLIEEYFTEGGFEVSEEVRAQVQKLTLQRHVASPSSSKSKTTRKL